MKTALRKNLAKTGLVLSNFIGSDVPACRPLLRGVHASYSKQFVNYRVYPLLDDSLETKQNMIFAYSNTLLAIGGGLSPNLSGGITLSDNYAPVERLKQQCQNL